MKKIFLFLIVGLMSVMIMAGSVSAIPLAEYIEMDLDNWTRLYDNDVPVAEGVAPSVGLESQAFVTMNDFSYTGTPGGPDAPAYWVAGDNGEYLHGVERNVVISQIITQADSSQTMYYSHVTNDPNDARYWEMELWQTGITFDDFTQTGTFPDPVLGSYLGLGPNNFDAIYTSLTTDASSSLFLQGRFAESTYFDEALFATNFGMAYALADMADDGSPNQSVDKSPGLIDALVAVNIPYTLLGGEWVNQETTPFGLGVNAFVDVDELSGVGDLLMQGLYGTGPDGSSYDLAIQNVRLFSETGLNVNNDGTNPLASTGGNWIISDDGVRMGVVPEPATMLLLGSGLIGLAGFARKKRNKK